MAQTNSEKRTPLIIACAAVFLVLAVVLFALITLLPKPGEPDPEQPEEITARTFFGDITSSVLLKEENGVRTETALRGGEIRGFFFRVSASAVNGGTVDGAVGLDVSGAEKGIRILSRPGNSTDGEALSLIRKAASAAMPDVQAVAAEHGWTLPKSGDDTEDTDPVTPLTTDAPITDPDTVPPETPEVPVSRVDPKLPQNNVVVDGKETVFDTETLPPETTEPITEPPETTEPVTEPPVTTEPVTEPPITTEPVTESPITTEPITEPPVTTEPVTEPPVTEIATQTAETASPADEGGDSV